MLKKFSPLFIVVLIVSVIWFIFYSSMPHNPGTQEKAESEFSTQRAFGHVTQMAQAPHFVGSSAHSQVRNYIVNELQELGLEVQTHTGYALNKHGMISRPQNILARIPGTGNANSLLLMSHYDSAPHSSYGAADAASGVAAIIEGLRAFSAEGTPPENDIIILFTDAEELGLLGAELFVKEHPWAQNVGLALNFEARGSGGNSIMLLETTDGNARLIKDFKSANPDFPVTNSLAYSVYKMLPNDTDLTVLREKGEINGFNFAFIDDHYDYHTANDIPSNLDKESLAHQGSYLMPLLDFFKDADLTDLNTGEDLVYFSLPLGEIISYPFSWTFPLLIITFLLFLAVLFYGFSKKQLEGRAIMKGAIPFFISVIGAGVLVFLLWQFFLMIYPEYSEMAHGFTYNGYQYIGAAVFISLTICFLIYHLFSSPEKQADYFVVPIFFWLLLCTLIAFILPGASYFTIPALFAVIQLGIMIQQQRPNPFLMLLLSLPSLLVLVLLVVLFPVALGLKMLYLTALLTVFIFVFFLPVFGYFKRKKFLAVLCFLAFNVFFIRAHFLSDFNAERPKPNSLVYVFDADTETATWNTYDGMIDAWTEPYFGEDPVNAPNSEIGLSSKYGSSFSYSTSAPAIEIQEPGIVFEKLNSADTTAEISRYSLKIAPNRKIHRMELFADHSVSFEEFEVNNLKADSVYLGAYPFHMFTKRWQNRLLTYHAANRDTLSIEFAIKEENLPEFVLYEASYDLLENEALNVQPRDSTMIPRPFVVNDAVLYKKTIKFE